MVLQPNVNVGEGKKERTETNISALTSPSYREPFRPSNPSTSEGNPASSDNTSPHTVDSYLCADDTPRSAISKHTCIINLREDPFQPDSTDLNKAGTTERGNRPPNGEPRCSRKPPIPETANRRSFLRSRSPHRKVRRMQQAQQERHVTLPELWLASLPQVSDRPERRPNTCFLWSYSCSRGGWRYAGIFARHGWDSRPSILRVCRREGCANPVGSWIFG